MSSKANTRRAGKLSARKLFTDYSYLVSFILILIIAWWVNHNFFAWRNITTIFRQSATTTGIIALGMTRPSGVIR